ncbi:MAG: beta-propeller domain-containing protein, partial [Thaumarchaeota archaeon]|nr:beta-propeller domain-containing protein [Nitrososphaerota archaeon]
MRLRTSDTPVPRRHLRALAALSAAAVLLALVAATQAPDASATAATTATIAAATSPAPPITGIQYMGNVGSDRIVTDKVALIIISDNASEPVCGHTRTCLDSHRTMATSGQTILWHNPTDDPHVMVSGSPGGISGLFDTGVIAPGGNKNIEIDALGRHEYFCVVHPWVRGVIHVAASPTWHHSPLEQQEMGVLPEHIVCGADVHLGYRTSDAAPVCLPERGLRMHAERGLVIPRDAGITSERLDIDKERFADMLTAYMGHEDVLVTTESADDLEEHREKITYKREVMAQIYNSIRLASTTEPDEGFTVRDDGTVIHSTGTPSAHTLEEILGIQSRSIDAAGEDRGGPRQEADVAEYSQTNIQVAGVDEPDFVKNDADSIYVIAQNDNIAMVNVDGSTGGLSAPGISPYIRGAEYILLHQDTLAVLAYDGESTTVTLLGVSAGPAVLARLGIGGELRDARMINDTIYVMTASGGGELPALRDLIGGNGDDGHEGGMHEIHFFKSGMASDVLYTVTAIPLSDTSQSRSASFVTGHADTVYVSADNIYVAHIQQEYGATEALFADGLFFRHAIGSLEPHERVKMYAMEAGGDLRGMAWLVLDSLESGDFGSLVSELESDGTAPEWRHRQNTSIHRIAVDGTSMRYAASGLVGGWLLDSFALNQGADGMLRAVTASAGDGGPQSNVYTLDEDMDVVGALEGIAPGETLHSARFSVVSVITPPLKPALGCPRR